MPNMIECQRQCGFLVHTRYYRDKRNRFIPGICARCQGPARVVDADTRSVIPGARFNTDAASPGYGLVLGIESEEGE